MDGRHITVARFPSFTTARPQSPDADEASAAEVRRLAHELERTRELLARERATIAREMQSGKDELLAMDRQINDLQERLQRLRHKNVLLRARVAQVSRERDLAQDQCPRSSSRTSSCPATRARSAPWPPSSSGPVAGRVPATFRRTGGGKCLEQRGDPERGGADADELSAVDRRRAAYRQLVDGELATGDGERVLFFVHSVDLRHAPPT